MIPITKVTIPPVDRMLARCREVFESGMLTNGNQVTNLEREIGTYLTVPHVTATSSCTLGLTLALKTLGVKGQAIVPAFSFFVTAQAPLWNNIRPVFVDIEPKHYAMDPCEVVEAITPNTGVIIATHIFGHPAPVKELTQIAEDHNIPLLFDAAHAFGAEYHGKKIGGFGTAEVFSASPTKLFTTAEGGFVTTSDEKLAQDLKHARNYGHNGDYNSTINGLNARMSELHAAVGRETLPYVDSYVQQRNEMVSYYQKKLALLGISFQDVAPGVRHTYKDFSLYIDPEKVGCTRDQLAQGLLQQGISAKKYFWPTLPNVDIFKPFVDRAFPVADDVAEHVLSIPLYSHMKREEADTVVAAIEHVIQQNKLTTQVGH